MKFTTKQINIFGGCLQLKAPFDQAQAIGELQSAANSGKVLDVEIKIHRNKRSLNANAYCWTLVHEIARVLKLKDEDVYREAIRKAGVKEFIALTETAFERFSRDWGSRGLGCFVERLGELRGMDGVYTACVYYGSSQYDTKEMSVFIDYLVDEAKGLGCDVLSEAEKSLLIEKWGESNGR